MNGHWSSPPATSLPASSCCPSRQSDAAAPDQAHHHGAGQGGHNLSRPAGPPTLHGRSTHLAPARPVSAQPALVPGRRRAGSEGCGSSRPPVEVATGASPPPTSLPSSWQNGYGRDREAAAAGRGHGTSPPYDSGRWREEDERRGEVSGPRGEGHDLPESVSPQGGLRGPRGHKAFSISEEHEHEHPRSALRFPHRSLSCPSAVHLGSAYLHRWYSEKEEEHRDSQLKKFTAMQSSTDHKRPESVVSIPSPDYPETPDCPETSKANRNSIVFVEKFKDIISHIRTIEELYQDDVPEPVPDYQDEDTPEFPPPPAAIATNDTTSIDKPPTSPKTTGAPTVVGIRARNGSTSSPEEDGELIQPKRLMNPCLVSKERQALHRELLLNYKLGKDVLQKPELNKILAQRKDKQKKKEWEELQASKRTSLELRLEKQASKLKETEEDKMKVIKEEPPVPEFLQIQRRFANKTPTSPTT